MNATALSADDPGVRGMLERYIAKTGIMPLEVPTWWFGVAEGERTFAVCGVTPVQLGIRIDYLLFDGTVRGFRAMVRLADWFFERFATADIFFRTTWDNRVMRSIFEGRYGAQPKVVGYEVKARV